MSLKKLQEQYLAEKLKRVGTQNATDEDIKNDNHEIIKGSFFHHHYSFISFSILRSRKKIRY